MSGGLMSCVRENSPPLDMDINASGPLSLPEPRINTSDLFDNVHSSSHQNIMSSTPLAAHSSVHHLEAGSGATTPLATPPNTEQQKRRRFHPLRNLRRIFRRRTITSTTATTVPQALSSDTPTSTLSVAPTSSTSEKNLRSATLSSITSVASASSPSSPLTHQQLHDAYLTQSLPKSKSSYISLLGGVGKNKSHDHSVNTESKSKSKHKHKNQKHQQQQQSKELELPEDDAMFGTTTQTSTTYHHHHQQQQQHHVQHHATATTTSTSSISGTKSSLLSQRQSIGVAVFPGAMQRNFFTERQKLRSVGDSSQDLDSGSGNDSGTGGGHLSLAAKNSSASGGEMSDSQRSLSEGRLIDSDYSRDGLSQSHDSVFSESATASSLSIVLKAELADVLRKRRNRPDASDEDLGLPRSPASPQRRVLAKSNVGGGVGGGVSSSLQSKQTLEKQSEVSSLSLLSMNSADGDDLLATSTANNSMATEVVREHARYSRSSTMSSISMTSDILRHRDSSSEVKDEVDLFSSDWQRLSHSAAKHKMAIRPAKKKGGPSRQHRRTLETSIPEANEELNKFANKKLLEVKGDLDAKAKTRSLPPCVNAAKLMEEHSTGVSVKNTAFKESTNMTSLTTSSSAKAAKLSAVATPTTTNQTNSTKVVAVATPTTTSSNNIFGFRSISAKATAMFESKDTTEELSQQKTEVLKKPEPLADKTEPVLETQESGFLRRLMHRNSKRSIAKANAGDDDTDVGDMKPNEPKKLQTSSMNMEAKSSYSSSSFIQDVTKSEFSYISSTDEKHRELKNKEFTSESRSAFSPMLGNFLTTSICTTTPIVKDDKKPEEVSPSKPKSGPAARQRYMPQNISNENLSTAGNDELLSTSKESILSKSSANEMFQSTSIIREITKQQNTTTTSPSKPEHHFEKKPKIVGLSAFQQKVSRSNDSFGRVSSNNTSVTSLDQTDVELHPPVRVQIYEQKSRKSVEKSKSFRAYDEEKPTIPTVHNNMPSLPDLSLNLRVPYYKDFVLNETEYQSPSPPEPADEKHTSLGFEINDNKLIKPEREHRKSFSNYDKNVIMTTTTGPQTTSKSTGQKFMTPTISLGPSLSPSTTCNRNISEIESNIDMIVTSPFISVIRKSSNFSEQQTERIETTLTPERVRPTVLPLKKEKSLSEDNVLNSPSTANVTLREKSLNKQNLLFTNSSGSLEPSKDGERKSAPAPATANTKANGFRSNSTRRSSSVVESLENSQPSVPEFMKIQLNRVDPMRHSKSHVVLAKNIKETPPMPIPTKSRESSPEKEDDFRRLSSESVDINERSSPEFEKRFSAVYHEAINKQAKLCIGLPPKSPIKKTMPTITPILPATPTTPPTPTINERDARQEVEIHFKLPDTKADNSNANANANSLSLQERRRLFMSEDKTKVEKKVEEIKYERKKSINEEISRKSVMKSETVEQKESPTENGVILRKKSFASSTSHLSMNGSAVSNSNNNNNHNGNAKKDDPTPELMKVFARRSLKVKDEDLDKMLNTTIVTGSNSSCNNTTVSAPQTLKKFSSTSSNPSVDSDKENQSASEEKLDKLPKLDIEQCITITKVSASQTHANHSSSNGNAANNQRNSLADFRHTPTKVTSPGLSLNNNNNNNNNNNSPVNGSAVVNNKSFLPPIKIAGFRHVSMERINNNNNNNNSLTSPTKSTTLERSSLKLADLGSTTAKTENSTATIISKTIERSATVGEFKGIHQRRAEWEQRAKEALK